jgi:hypothetical protein
LTVAEWVTSVGVKQKLIESIKQSDVKAFLERKHWTPEVQQVLLDIGQYPELKKEIKQVIEFWEKTVLKEGTEYEVQLYQSKMLLAYIHNDEYELNNIEEPDAPNYEVGDLSYHDHKEFYRALIKLKKEPESSYVIFRQLCRRYTHYPVFAINQMAAKMNLAETRDDLKIYNEALEEWNVYSSHQKDLDEEALGSTFLTNKLSILLKLGEYDELDRIFNDFEKPYQMLPDIIEVKVESLIKRKRNEEAFMILKDAENYHQLSGDEETEFIKALKTKIGGNENVLLLNSYYTRIFDSPPEKLIDIFPANLNGQRQLKRFLTAEFASAAQTMLDKIVSIDEIKNEDKYNDLVETLLNSKMNPWGWFVSDQSRGGYSDSENNSEKNQPGERDFKIFDVKGTFAICEAFIYRTPAPAKKHLKKIFDYHPKRENLLMLIYDLNETKKAARNWNNYLKNILPKIVYPKGYGYVNCEDVSIEFGHNKKSAVRIARSTHEDDLSLYHIFVSVNYKVNI